MTFPVVGPDGDGGTSLGDILYIGLDVLSFAAIISMAIAPHRG